MSIEILIGLSSWLSTG